MNIIAVTLVVAYLLVGIVCFTMALYNMEEKLTIIDFIFNFVAYVFAWPLVLGAGDFRE